ncbi:MULTISPECIES: 4-(cytidine 5'-diphospho)-2-C-methyl-D-erythritol kinase [unclassified Rhizobium]|jgi:4-diphosphocytidyl-2-C-methyl-D-erythritol kinase|uniref:4-(cytidine 5'-diphospho)-2-C-methyl-D-erythritol kinase n=1 Tax=unclassified Rhizobium TaxID=2613769 RepID=UPI000645BBD3|nr:MULTISPECIES: 4-(cytidine 5'-diphospho)-2-C-methyl-D-erythritol kinase [unclassified Rhizobium]MBN8950360.1 4-(cytidine 5'-diphospho)-2-C-methyl-D-erythritol kinase [Rhizobium tropici]OJY68895.1 MAG: 4-(cytidine 5'-diphospho)-2-C-methyl-D-erythritol kinase [Rhizobium sp. 60-20]RKD74342.1 4-diphosphocytidyl-2-C-methyl-D-erythritol kinase [Rhizobium sp. WW_1]
MNAILAAGDFDLTEEAPAKINLALHVTGRRADGYHLLDMLVSFARHGDRLGFRAGEHDEFSLSGRFGPLLSADAEAGDNLVLKARDLLRQTAQAAGFDAPSVHIHLEKNLPIASGIGGGSADAAATLRGLMRLWRIALPSDTIKTIALKLGADVPMCLASQPLVARGIGEAIDLLPAFPSFPMVLGNPLVGVSTADVFRQLSRKDNPPLLFPSQMPRSYGEWIDTIRNLRNDLEPPARLICNEIAVLSGLIESQSPILTRMSGSGATCFGIFADIEQAKEAAASFHRQRPDWYFQVTETIAGEA